MAHNDFLETNAALRLRVRALRGRLAVRQSLGPNAVCQYAAVTPSIRVFRNAGTTRHQQQAISVRDGAEQLHCHESGNEVVAKQVPEVAAKCVTRHGALAKAQLRHELWIRISEQKMDVGVASEGRVRGDGAADDLEVGG